MTDDIFGESLRALAQMMRLRQDIPIPFTNKVIQNKNRIPNIVQDTMANLWRNNELKPLIVKTFRNAGNNHFTFIIHLPFGVVSFEDFAEKENYFRDATGCEIIISRRNNSFILEAFAEKIGTFYPYSFYAADYPNMRLPIPVGYSAKGLVVRDLAEMYSLLIGGIPRSGKSNMLHVIIASLIQNENCIIVGLDYKESEYAIYLQDFGLLATNTQESLILLSKLNQELDRRKKLVRGKYVKIHDMPANQRPPFIVVFADEVTEIQDKNVQYMLNTLPRIGAAFGFITIVATQKPSAKTFRSGNFTELRSLMDGRMCFNVRSAEDSKMILNNTSGVRLPSVKGRCIFQWDAEIEVQTMYLNPKDIKKGVANIVPQQPQTLLPPR